MDFKMAFKGIFSSQAWWLTSVILTTQEAEIGRIEVPGQPTQKS
jgi:hypothetical protein